MTEGNRLSRTPVLVINLGTILRSYGSHLITPYCPKTGFEMLLDYLNLLISSGLLRIVIKEKYLCL
ncbi:hypothetical protein Syn6312_3029 [Synechococcus sp. PCC 6312]|nr:hypothetical protein Syn6312_3029 [Synechococcus sp. PCC 6312]